MADPVVNRIRLIPRPKDFLDRNIGASGELYYSKTSSTIRAYDGNLRGGVEIVSEDNLARTSANKGIASVKQIVTILNTGEGNKYVIDGVYRPSLELVKGYTYVFNQNDQTNLYYPNAEGTTLNRHPLFLSTPPDGIHDSAGTYYETGVEYILDEEVVTRAIYIKKFASSTTRQMNLTVTSTTPTDLYYFCQYHSGMGLSLKTVSPGGGGSASVSVSTGAPENPEAGAIWFNSQNGRIYVYLKDNDNAFWVQPAYPIPSSVLDLGITDGTVGQVLTTDGAGNFTFAGAGTLGNIVATGSTLTTDDSSNIVFTPAVTFNSDLTVENTLYAENIESTSTGVPTLTSDTNINLSAATRVIVNKSPINLASYTTTDRANITATNGDVIYNSTTNKFQGYANGAWADLN